ncbi:hypothetical protein KUCAC02_032042 [Chaenocephalus aceratus]|nr:hypothetical protein KUCAC02_032042 [Chaenocephalus aceratus]
MDENGRDITYPGMDAIATAALKGNLLIYRDMLPSLSKEDLRDLLPGPEHFFRRRTIWRLTHDDNEGQERDLCRPSTSHGTCDFSPIPTPQPSLFASSSSSCLNPCPSPVFSPTLLPLSKPTTPTWCQQNHLKPVELSGKLAPEAEQLCASETESPQTQARHYKTLQAMYKTKARPNKMDVAQLLDLEIQARRAFIDSDVTKEQDRPSNILKAYPCFGELDHLMDELRRVFNQGNSHFLTELKTRWGTFCERAQFYGVFKKLMRPPQLDKVKHSIAMMKALPEMFPSPIAPPKKLRHASEAVLHVLESAEDPNTFLQTRPLSSPVVIIIAKPTCIATLLSVVQTEVLLDAIHDCDMTTSYKKAMADWKKFISD